MSLKAKSTKRGLTVAASVFSLFIVIGGLGGSQMLPSMILLGGVLAAFFYARNSTPKPSEIREYVLSVAANKFPAFHTTNEMQGTLGNSGVILDEGHKKIVIYENQGASIGVYNFRDLMRSEVVEDGDMINSTVRTSQVASAIVGAVVFGGVGALVGGLTGKSRSNSAVSKISLMVTINDRSNPLYQIDLLDVAKPQLRSSDDVKQLIRMANHSHSLFSVLIKQADDEDRMLAAQTQATPTQPPAPPNFDRATFADELSKLAKLKEQGVLTDAEFVDMKTALINRARAA